MKILKLPDTSVDSENRPPALDDAGVSALRSAGDYDAVSMWLRARGGRSQHTARTYARCSGRLLQWCVEYGEVTFAKMTVADAQAHLNALRNPAPHWLIPQNDNGRLLELHPKSQRLKRPMTDKGIAFARTVLSQLFHYLLTAGYVRRNVFALTEIPAAVHADIADKVLSQKGRAYLWVWLREQLQDPKNTQNRIEAARNRWICSLLYYTGIRTKEAIAGKMCDVVRDTDGWQLRVIGKGAKLRRVTITNALASELIFFRESMGLSAWPTPTDQMPLIPRARNAAQMLSPISDRMLRKIVSDLCKSAAKACEDLHVAAELQRMSPHWFRHTSATHRQEAGARLETTQQELGHANPKTTLRYAKIASRTLREDAERFTCAAVFGLERKE